MTRASLCLAVLALLSCRGKAPDGPEAKAGAPFRFSFAGAAPKTVTLLDQRGGQVKSLSLETVEARFPLLVTAVYQFAPACLVEVTASASLAPPITAGIFSCEEVRAEAPAGVVASAAVVTSHVGPGEESSPITVFEVYHLVPTAEGPYRVVAQSWNDGGRLLGDTDRLVLELAL